MKCKIGDIIRFKRRCACCKQLFPNVILEGKVAYFKEVNKTWAAELPSKAGRHTAFNIEEELIIENLGPDDNFRRSASTS